MEGVILVMSIIVVLIQLAIWVFVIRGIYRAFKRAAGATDDSGKVRQSSVRTTRTVTSSSGKVTAGLNRASKAVYREQARLDRDEALHESIPGECKYSTQDPSFSFNGKSTVDQFAALRKANASHEKHLRRRIGDV